MGGGLRGGTRVAWAVAPHHEAVSDGRDLERDPLRPCGRCELSGPRVRWGAETTNGREHALCRIPPPLRFAHRSSRLRSRLYRQAGTLEPGAEEEKEVSAPTVDETVCHTFYRALCAPFSSVRGT